MSARWIAFLSLALSVGCGFFARMGTVKMNSWANPSVAATGAVRAAPIVDCSSTRDVIPSDVTRTWLAEQFFPSVWRRVGAADAPVIARADDPALCKHLYEEWFDGADWSKPERKPTLAAIAGSLLAESAEDQVFVVAMGRRFYCTPETREVRDAQGGVVGSIDTGRDVCEENGEVDLAGYLLSRDGDLLYLGSGRIQYFAWFEDKDTQRATDAFMKKYPVPSATATAAR
jgi:hypothetical protein